jgi:hypothetical protein
MERVPVRVKDHAGDCRGTDLRREALIEGRTCASSSGLCPFCTREPRNRGFLYRDLGDRCSHRANGGRP